MLLGAGGLATVAGPPHHVSKPKPLAPGMESCLGSSGQSEEAFLLTFGTLASPPPPPLPRRHQCPPHFSRHSTPCPSPAGGPGGAGAARRRRRGAQGCRGAEGAAAAWAALCPAAADTLASSAAPEAAWIALGLLRWSTMWSTRLRRSSTRCLLPPVALHRTREAAMCCTGRSSLPASHLRRSLGTRPLPAAPAGGG